jgi:hypothetical protein
MSSPVELLRQRSAAAATVVDWQSASVTQSTRDVSNGAQTFLSGHLPLGTESRHNPHHDEHETILGTPYQSFPIFRITPNVEAARVSRDTFHFVPNLAKTASIDEHETILNSAAIGTRQGHQANLSVGLPSPHGGPQCCFNDSTTKAKMKEKLSKVRDRFGFIPESHFESEPSGPAKNVSPMSQELVALIEGYRDKYQPGDIVSGY